MSSAFADFVMHDFGLSGRSRRANASSSMGAAIANRIASCLLLASHFCAAEFLNCGLGTSLLRAPRVSKAYLGKTPSFSAFHFPSGNAYLVYRQEGAVVKQLITSYNDVMYRVNPAAGDLAAVDATRGGLTLLTDFSGAQIISRDGSQTLGAAYLDEVTGMEIDGADGLFIAERARGISWVNIASSSSSTIASQRLLEIIPRSNLCAAIGASSGCDVGDISFDRSSEKLYISLPEVASVLVASRTGTSRDGYPLYSVAAVPNATLADYDALMADEAAAAGRTVPSEARPTSCGNARGQFLTSLKASGGSLFLAFGCSGIAVYDTLTGKMRRIAGQYVKTPAAYTGDGGLATAAGLTTVLGLEYDGDARSLYVSHTAQVPGQLYGALYGDASIVVCEVSVDSGAIATVLGGGNATSAAATQGTIATPTDRFQWLNVGAHLRLVKIGSYKGLLLTRTTGTVSSSSSIATAAAMSPILAVCRPDCPAGQVCQMLPDGPSQPCPVGRYCERGTVRLFTRSPSEGDTTLTYCPSGTYCDQGSVAPTLCPTGFRCPDARSKTPCDAGWACSRPGTVTLADAERCIAGFYCPTGSSDPRAKPTQPGLFSRNGSAYPNGLCAPGHYCTGGAGSASVFGVGKCPPGTYCPAGSGPIPTPCDPGTWSNVTGRTGMCDPCPIGTYQPQPGAASLSQCIQCEGGRSTSHAGAASRDECVELPFSCPAGTQPLSKTVKSLLDCGPLSCTGGLTVSNGNRSCMGCPGGYAGDGRTCTPCNATAGELCPGLGAAPLPRPDRLQARISALQLSSSTAAASSGARMLPVQGAVTVSEHAVPALQLDAAAAVAGDGHAAAGSSSRGRRRLAAAAPVPTPGGCAALAAVAQAYAASITAGTGPTAASISDSSYSSSSLIDTSTVSSFFSNLTGTNGGLSPEAIIGIVVGSIGLVIIALGTAAAGIPAATEKQSHLGHFRQPHSSSSAATSASAVAAAAAAPAAASDPLEDDDPDSLLVDQAGAESKSVAPPTSGSSDSAVPSAGASAVLPSASKLAAAALASKTPVPGSTTAAAGAGTATAGRRCCASASTCLSLCCTRMDSFHLFHRVRLGAAPRRHPTPLGGCCTALSVLAVLTAWAFLILQYRQNYAVEAITTAPAGLAQRSAFAQAGAIGTSASGMQGVHVVLYAAGQGSVGTGSLSDCSNATWTGSGLYTGAWVAASSATCGSLAQHVFACPRCVFAPGSALAVSLPFTCQSLVIEAYAVSHDGSVSNATATAAAPAQEAVASASTSTGSSAASTYGGATLMTSVSWAVPPLPVLRTDAFLAGSPSTRGARLLAPALQPSAGALGVAGSAWSTGGAVLSTSASQADAFLPASARVEVLVDVSPPAIYSDIVLSPRVTAGELFSSLISVLSLWGAFGMAFKHGEHPLMALLASLWAPFQACWSDVTVAGGKDDSSGSNGSYGSSGSNGSDAAAASGCCSWIDEPEEGSADAKGAVRRRRRRHCICCRPRHRVPPHAHAVSVPVVSSVVDSADIREPAPPIAAAAVVAEIAAEIIDAPPPGAAAAAPAHHDDAPESAAVLALDPAPASPAAQAPPGPAHRRHRYMEGVIYV